MNMKWNMLLLVGLFFWTNVVLGEGSRDLYPENVRGNRAFLVSKPLGRNAFANQASHYAYAQEGETIAVASSAQNIGIGRIILTAPDGKKYQTKSNNIGKISEFNGSTRAAELAGPRVGYVPFEVPVTTGQDGIWLVEFTSPDVDPINGSLIEPYNLRANANWKQHEEGSLIAAWDISIRNKNNTDWVAGRVFATVLQLHISKESLAYRDGAFYGRNYVLTDDGYIYHVDGNGSHGIDFAYFVNSSGILNEQNTPSYKSADEEKSAKFHNPNSEDEGLHITHKMFYNLPDNKMPRESRGCVPSGRTWLFNSQRFVEVKDIQIAQAIDNSNKIASKGISMSFNTNRNGRYKILISSRSEKHSFDKREISIEAKEGVNVFFWDGLDGQGKPMPNGKDYSIGVSVSLVEGEIHFPYFDMEINPNGILVDRINADGSRHSDAIMFWDDSAVTRGQDSESSKPNVNRAGTPSRIDGHRWGTYSSSKFINNGSSNGGYGAYSYGNERVMDTWAYTAKLQAEVELQISFGIPSDIEGGGAALPIEGKKYVELYQGGDVVFDLLGGDSRNVSLSSYARIEILEVPYYGDLTINGSTVLYKTKDTGYVGNDVLSYRLIDENGLESMMGKVYFEIKMTTPVAKDDFFEIVYNTVDISDVTNNDFVEYSYLNKESFRIVEHPVNGRLSKDADGKWIYESVDKFVGKDQFRYQIMDGNGNWSNIATVHVYIKGLFIPNTITPNGDLKNDTFHIVGLSYFDHAEVSVMDRFGRIVFASPDYKNNWSVPSNLTSGVYYYVFKGSKHGQKPVLNKGSLMVLTSMNFSK